MLKATWCVGWLKVKTRPTDNWQKITSLFFLIGLWMARKGRWLSKLQLFCSSLSPYCLSPLKWTGNFFNFSGTSTWRGFTILIQVIRIKNAICLTDRKKSLWATDMEGQGMLKEWSPQHANEVQWERRSALLDSSISTNENTLQRRNSQALPFSSRTYGINCFVAYSF